MRILLLGPPGAGKGTQGVMLAEHFGAEHLAAGDLLRAEVAAATELGRAAKAYMDQGDFVPDQLVVEMMIARMATAAAAGGYIVDGFPRTIDQALAAADAALRRNARADAAVYLRADEEELVRRLVKRGATGARSDDTEDVIRHRLELFNEKTQPMIDYYRERRGILIEIDAEQSVEEVFQSTVERLAQHVGAGERS